ncbi:MAG: hypothetical protein QOJ59_1915 [Thermomicrobiales bacterium]|jgi:YD repeat-containing protein|nr:hypothetical protein [Thermomicrobiales bacterium]
MDKLTDPLDHATAYAYDADGRLIRVRHVRGGVNEDLDLVWDLAGNLLSWSRTRSATSGPGPTTGAACR